MRKRREEGEKVRREARTRGKGKEGKDKVKGGRR